MTSAPKVDPIWRSCCRWARSDEAGGQGACGSERKTANRRVSDSVGQILRDVRRRECEIQKGIRVPQDARRPYAPLCSTTGFRGCLAGFDGCRRLLAVAGGCGWPESRPVVRGCRRQPHQGGGRTTRGMASRTPAAHDESRTSGGGLCS
jgi:hypothetical protein